MLPIAKIGQLIECCDNRNDPIHDSGHLRRTAAGAAWFVKMSGGSRAEQQTAYLAGLLHDIVRPVTTKSNNHEVASAKLAAKMLKRLKVDARTMEQITAAIKDHGGTSRWDGAVHESVFFADKVFEQMGNIALFRRCVWVGECKELHKETVLDSVITNFENRIRYLKSLRFARPFRPLVAAQFSSPVEFLKALRAGEGWAMYLAAAGFRNGAFDKLSVQKFVRHFVPIASQDAAARAEALRYVNGQRWKGWTALVNKTV